MISWIQHHLIRHGRWVFLSLLALIIVAFVFTIGNTPGCTTDRSGYEENLFYGIDLNAPRERDPIVQKVSISAFLNGQQIQSDEQFQSELTSRIAMLHLADASLIPAPSQEALADYIKTKNAFRGPEGAFSPDEYTRFVDNVESNPRAPQGLVLQVLAEDYRIDQVEAALSGPGYLLPSEALAQAQRNQTELAVVTAELSYSSFEPELEPDEEDLRDYYEANKQQYEIPERIKASYIAFPADDYATDIAEASEAELRQHFAENRAEFVEAYKAEQPAPADGESAEESPVTFNQARPLVARSFAEEQAMRAANEAAQAFAFQLYRDEIGRDTAAFNRLLNESGLTLQRIEPYTMAGARQRALSPEMLQSAFDLSGSRYYSDAYPIDGGFAVLLYEGRIAPVIPPYKEVAGAVRRDYLTAEKRKRFNEKGASLKAELESALEAGQSFVEAAEALGLEARSFETFPVREAPDGLNRSLVSQAQRMDAGEVASMTRMGDAGIFLYLKTKDVPEIGDENADFTQAQAMLRRWGGFATRSSLINELVLRGMPAE